MTIDPLEESALVMLRAFVAGLEACHFVVTEFRAADNPREIGLSIQLALREPDGESTPPPAAPPTTPPASTTCPRCSSASTGKGDTEGFCNSCGHTWPRA